jgi:hypothetical protein
MEVLSSWRHQSMLERLNFRCNCAKIYSDSRKKGQPEGWPAMVRLTDENIARFFSWQCRLIS